MPVLRLFLVLCQLVFQQAASEQGADLVLTPWLPVGGAANRVKASGKQLALHRT